MGIGTEKYTEMFKKMKRAQSGKLQAPHKPILLLSVLMSDNFDYVKTPRQSRTESGRTVNERICGGLLPVHLAGRFPTAKPS